MFVLRSFFRNSGFAEVTLTRKSSNKFGFFILYTLLWMNLIFTRIHTKAKRPEDQTFPIFTRIHLTHNKVYLPIICRVLQKLEDRYLFRRSYSDSEKPK